MGATQKTWPDPQKYMTRAILAIAAFAAFAPVFVHPDFYFPFAFLKAVVFRTAVQVMALLYVALAVRFSHYRPRLSRFTMAVIAYFGVQLVSSLPLISVSPWTSWWGSFARMGGMISQVHLFVYFFLLTQVVRQLREWVVLFSALLFSGVLMGFSGLVQQLDLNYLYLFRPDPRMKGATGNANFFAACMVLNFFLALWFISRKDRQEIYPVVARTWFWILLLLDAFLVVRDLSHGAPGAGLIVGGLSIPAVAGFAGVLHATTLLWLVLRRRAVFGLAVFSLLAAGSLYWIYQSQTRSAAVGIAASLVLLPFLYLLRGGGRSGRWIAAGLALASLLLPVFIFLSRGAAWVQKDPFLSRFTTFSAADQGLRLLAWRAGVAGILDRPLFGWGPENYGCAFNRHFPAAIVTDLEYTTWWDRAHNLAVDIGTTTGVLGLACYLLMFGFAVVVVIRNWARSPGDPSHAVVAATFIAYLFQSFFTFDTLNTDITLYLMLAYVAGAGRGGESSARASNSLPVRPWSWMSVGVAAAVLVPAFWSTVLVPSASNLLLNQTVRARKERIAGSEKPQVVFRDEIADLFRRANSYQTTGRYEVREEFAEYTTEILAAPHIPAEDKVRAVQQAVSFLEESVRQDPSNARHYLYFASLSNRAVPALERAKPELARALAERSVALLRQAEVLSPGRPQVYYERGRALASLRRYDEAIASAEKALSLTPGIPQFHLDLVAFNVAAGRDEAAAKEWQGMKAQRMQVSRADYDRIIRLYNARKQYVPMVALYKELLERKPDDAAALAHLATTYRDMGDLDAARQTAMKAAAASPTVAAELQIFLESLEKRR